MKILESEYFRMSDGCSGICLSCGEMTDGCEPDARKRECPSCGEFKVYGLEEALIMGHLEIIPDTVTRYGWSERPAKKKRVSAKEKARHAEPYVKHTVTKAGRILSRFNGRLSLGKEFLKAFKDPGYGIVTEPGDPI